MTKLLKCFLFLLCLPPLGAAAQDLLQYFKETEGCFALYDLKGDSYLRYNEERCRRRFSPFSTFKIGYLPSVAQVTAPKSADGGPLVYRATLELSDYNLLFAPVKINGQEARALIDSGNFRSVQLSSTLAQSLKLALTKTDKMVRHYEGKELSLTSGRIDSLAIGDYEQRDIEVGVIEGDVEKIAAQVGTKFDVILGWGFISQFHMLLDYKRLSMRFSARPLAAGVGAISLKYSVVKGAPIVRGAIAPGSNEEFGFLFDTGAPMCNLDLDLANAPKGTKVSKEVTLAERRFTLEFRAKDLTAIRKTLGCAGVIGNNLLRQYAVYFDPAAKAIHLSSG